MAYITEEAWRKIVLNRHVVLAVSIGLLVNAVFVLLSLTFGVVGVAIWLVLLLLVCGGVGLRVSQLLRQQQQPDTTVDVESVVQDLDSGPPSKAGVSVCTQTDIEHELTVDDDGLDGQPVAGTDWHSVQLKDAALDLDNEQKDTSSNNSDL